MKMVRVRIGVEDLDQYQFSRLSLESAYDYWYRGTIGTIVQDGSYPVSDLSLYLNRRVGPDNWILNPSHKSSQWVVIRDPAQVAQYLRNSIMTADRNWLEQELVDSIDSVNSSS